MNKYKAPRKLFICGETIRIARGEKGQYFRKCRARGKGKEGATQFNGVFGVWQNGVFLPDQDQARFRGRG